MSAVLEQYFQTVIVDKINEVISKQCQGIKNNLEAECNEIKSKINSLKKLESNYANLQNELESLKKLVSNSRQEKSKPVEESVTLQPTKTVKKTIATKKKTPAKKAVKK